MEEVLPSMDMESFLERGLDQCHCFQTMESLFLGLSFPLNRKPQHLTLLLYQFPGGLASASFLRDQPPGIWGTESFGLSRGEWWHVVRSETETGAVWWGPEGQGQPHTYTWGWILRYCVLYLEDRRFPGKP